MRIEVDVELDDETVEQAVGKLTHGLSHVASRVVRTVGPGGGWPIVEFVSDDAEQMVTLIERYYGSEDDANDARSAVRVLHDTCGPEWT